MSAQLADSLEENYNLICEVVRGMPPDAQARAKRAALAIERTVEALRKDSPHDPAVALGTAWAVFFIAQKLVEGVREGTERPLIQTLS